MFIRHKDRQYEIETKADRIKTRFKKRIIYHIKIIKLTINCNAITTWSAECPTDVTVTPDVGPFEPGDVLTCIANGYNPTYTWTGTANGGDIGSQTGSTYILPEGDFDVICTATIGNLICTVSATDSVAGTAVGKYE